MHTHWLKRFILQSTLAVGLLLIAGGLVFAAEPNRLPQAPFNATVSPVTLNLETDLGKSITTEIKVYNNGTMAERVKLLLATFTADETGAKPKLILPQGDEEYLQWLKFAETEFTVEAGQWKTVPVTFSPPAYADLSHYYSIIVTRAEETQYTETSVNAMPAILVLTTINSPNAKRQLEVVDFGIKDQVVEFLPGTFTIKVKNTGNVHIPPNGTIFIDGEGKRDVAVLPINPTSRMVLPGTEREYQVVWDDGFPSYAPKSENGQDLKDDKGNQLFGLQFNFDKIGKIRFGKYTAHLLMIYDNGERDVPIESQVSFWVIPWKLLLGAGVVVALLGYGLVSLFGTITKAARRSK